MQAAYSKIWTRVTDSDYDTRYANTPLDLKIGSCVLDAKENDVYFGTYYTGSVRKK